MKTKTLLAMRRHAVRETALVSAIVVCLTGAVHAVDNLWTGGTTDWNTATNWSLGRVPANPNGATEGDNFDDAVVNTAIPNPATITATLAAGPRDIVVGSGVDADGTVNHLAGTAATGPGNWMFVGRDAGTGTYNLADTGTVGIGVSGFGPGSGSLNVNGNLYVGGWASAGNAVFNMNTTGTLAIANQLQVGNGSGKGTFNLESGTVTTGTNWVEFGNGAGANGTLNMTGGTFTKGGNDHFSIGTNGGIGTGTIDGGALTVNNEIWLGQATGSLGNLYLNGGSITNNSYVAVGREGGTGNLIMTGGTWTKTGGGAFIVGASGPGSMMQSGGLVEVRAGDTWIGELGTGVGSFTLSDSGEFRANYFQIGRAAGSKGTVNLQGGTLRVAQIAGGNGAEQLYFDGTQIIATANQTNFIGGLDANQAVVNFGGLKIDSNGYNLGVPQALTGLGGVAKSGAGTLTLSGANSYEGGNEVTGGKLILSTAATLSGDCTVADGAGFGAIQVDPTQTLAVPNLILGTAGATTVEIDLGSAAGNPGVAPLTVTGALTLNGPVTVNVTDALPAVGSIPLVAYPLPRGGGGGFVLGTVPYGTVGTLEDNGFGLVSLNLTQATVLVWKGIIGQASAPWDIGTTADWTDRLAGAAATYVDPGAVLFDDTGVSTQIDLGTTVAPAKVTFNHTTTYLLQGAGKITGPTSLLKQGTGGLFLSNTTPNDYTGPTVLEGGTTSVKTLADGGSPSTIGASSANPANLVLGGGTLAYAGTTAVAIDRGFTISGANSGISTNRDLTMSGQVVCTAGNFTKTGTAKLTLTHPGGNSFGTANPGLQVNRSTLELLGAGTQTNTVGADCWIGATKDIPANLILNATSLSVQSWLVLGRGNGSNALTSTLTATNSVVTTGNFSTGYIAEQIANNCRQTITLTNTSWTNGGAVQLAESAGSTTTMTVAGTSAFTTAGALRMAMGTGTSTVNLTIQDAASVTKTGGWLAIGDGGTAKATVTVKNSASLVSTAGDFNIGDTGTSQGTLNLSDTGTVSSTGIVFIGKGTGTKGTLNQTGGTFSGNSWISIGRYSGGSGNAIGTVNVSAGTFSQTSPDNTLIVGEAGTGTLTVSGTGAVVAAGAVLVSSAATANGTVNLNGGTLTARQITEGAAGAGMGTFNFNGGTLIAGQVADANFMSLLDVVNVQAGGAVIHSSGQSIAINQNLLDGGGGGGLTKNGAGTLYLNGSHTYSGTTQVNSGTLGGAGSFLGPITVGAAADLNPGSPTGTLVAPTVTFAAGSTLTLDMASAVDTLQAGTLDITGAALVLNGTPNLPVHVLARYTTLTGTFVSVPALPAGYTLSYNYTGNGFTEIALTRAASGYETWAKTHITDLDPTADASAGGDPDHDGATNITEFALDGNPLSGAASGKVVGKVATVGGQRTLVITLPVRSGAAFSGATEQVSALIDGIIYKVQGSDELSAWTLAVSEVTGADKAVIELGMPALSTGWTYRTFQSPGTITADPEEFLRVVIATP